MNLKSRKIYSIDNYKQQKPLDFLWDNNDFSFIFNKQNTIIIDNSYNVTKNYSDNSILVESYCRLNEEDEILLTLKNKLSVLNKSNIKQNCKKIYSKKKPNINVKNYRCRKLRMPIIKSLSCKNIEKHLSI